MSAKTILVVDDDPMLRAGLQTMLQQRGYQTLEAEDGLDAKDLITDQRPDLVILDMMMPRWGGFAVLEHFRSKTNSPPFIMISAHESEKFRSYANQVGAIDYLHKPFSFDNLIERIDQLFEAAKVDSPSTERPTIRISCRGCGARIKAPMEMLGQSRPCPRCNLSLVIKPELPKDEGPLLVMEL